MKQNKHIRACGPFVVHSISQDGKGVRLVVYPAFPMEGADWAIRRKHGGGSGPGLLTAMRTAIELEEFLNQPYTKEEIAQWRATLLQSLR